MERPTSVECDRCGTEFGVGPKGRVPKRCPNCRAPKSAPEPTGEWPRQIGPCLWEAEDGTVIHAWAWPDP